MVPVGITRKLLLLVALTIALSVALAVVTLSIELLAVLRVVARRLIRVVGRIARSAIVISGIRRLLAGMRLTGIMITVVAGRRRRTAPIGLLLLITLPDKAGKLRQRIILVVSPRGRRRPAPPIRVIAAIGTRVPVIRHA